MPILTSALGNQIIIEVALAIMIIFTLFLLGGLIFSVVKDIYKKWKTKRESLKKSTKEPIEYGPVKCIECDFFKGDYPVHECEYEDPNSLWKMWDPLHGVRFFQERIYCNISNATGNCPFYKKKQEKKE